MDGPLFDTLVRSLRTNGTRRQGLAGLVLAGLLSLGAWKPTGDALAKKKRKRKKKPPTPPTAPVSPPPVASSPPPVPPPGPPAGPPPPQGPPPGPPTPGPPPTPPPGRQAVSMIDNAFSPNQLDIAVGTTVVWTNNGQMTHTVTANDGTFDSGRIAPDGTFQRTFTTPDQIAYRCTIHNNMTAQIDVT
jgi:Copper binding proteins, plastocyanin/azurin family